MFFTGLFLVGELSKRNKKDCTKMHDIKRKHSHKIKYCQIYVNKIKMSNSFLLRYSSGTLSL